ncbi:MAG: flagellar biosynthetic protein FliQ [Nitrospinota bacterium]|nr:MAG: flagellar biosynthetic protein FliQ [Nitrospinota bacterium]
MTPELIIDLGMRALQTALLLAAPPLLAGLLIGLLISIFQAVTQIQEQTLVLIPKILAVLIAMLIFLPWMLQTILNFTSHLFLHLPDYIR